MRVSRGREDGRPLLVALHGAGYDARYFDAPDASVHERALDAGFSFAAITRPGYPADEASARAQPDFSGSAVVVSAAIAELWQQNSTRCSGVVLIGHSVGAAISVHIASGKNDWPLVGVAISGIGDRPAPAPVDMFSRMPVDRLLTIPFSLARRFFYGDDVQLPDGFAGRFSDLLVPFPSRDVVEVNSSWSGDLPAVASRVTVPVHYRLAEFDQLWWVSDERVRAFAGYFVGSPSVDADIWRGAGHNIEHHLNGRSYTADVLRFAEACSA